MDDGDVPAPYKDMNRLQRGDACRDYPSEKIATLNRFAEQALRKLPNYTGSTPTFRKDFVQKTEQIIWPEWPDVYETLQLGAEFVTPNFWSTGKTGTIGGAALRWIEWTVYCLSGKDIAALARFEGEGGGEVLLLKGVKFYVGARSYEVNEQVHVWKLTLQEKHQ
jgi:hypothetical protein